MQNLLEPTETHKPDSSGFQTSIAIKHTRTQIATHLGDIAGPSFGRLL